MVPDQNCLCLISKPNVCGDVWFGSDSYLAYEFPIAAILLETPFQLIPVKGNSNSWPSLRLFNATISSSGSRVYFYCSYKLLTHSRFPNFTAFAAPSGQFGVWVGGGVLVVGVRKEKGGVWGGEKGGSVVFTPFSPHTHTHTQRERVCVRCADFF